MTSWFVAVPFAVVFVLPSAAQAYIDPGSGSLLVQALIAGALGALMAILTSRSLR